MTLMRQFFILLLILCFGLPGLSRTVRKNAIVVKRNKIQRSVRSNPVLNQPAGSNSQLASGVVKKEVSTQVNTGFSMPHFSIGYDFRTNVADEKKEHLYNHEMSLGVSSQSKGKLTHQISGGLGFQYRSIDQEVVDKQNESDLTDASLGYSVGGRWNPIWGWKTAINNSFPLSQESQLEGYKSVATFGGSVTATITSQYSISQSLYLGYIFNEFEYSPSRSNSINPNASLSYKLGNSFSFSKMFSVSLSGGVRSTRYLDASTSLNYNTSVAMNLSYRDFGASTFYSVGGFTDPGQTEFWYLDEYRHMLGLGLSYEF